MTKVSQGLPEGADFAGRSKKIEICIPLKNLLIRMKMRKMMRLTKTMLTLIVSQFFDQHVF